VFQLLYGAFFIRLIPKFKVPNLLLLRSFLNLYQLPKLQNAPLFAYIVPLWVIIRVHKNFKEHSIDFILQEGQMLKFYQNQFLLMLLYLSHLMYMVNFLFGSLLVLYILNDCRLLLILHIPFFFFFCLFFLFICLFFFYLLLVIRKFFLLLLLLLDFYLLVVVVAFRFLLILKLGRRLFPLVDLDLVVFVFIIILLLLLIRAIRIFAFVFFIFAFVSFSFGICLCFLIPFFICLFVCFFFFYFNLILALYNFCFSDIYIYMF
jgi:hypothetical protein